MGFTEQMDVLELILNLLQEKVETLETLIEKMVKRIESPRAADSTII